MFIFRVCVCVHVRAYVCRVVVVVVLRCVVLTCGLCLLRNTRRCPSERKPSNQHVDFQLQARSHSTCTEGCNHGNRHVF